MQMEVQVDGRLIQILGLKSPVLDKTEKDIISSVKFLSHLPSGAFHIEGELRERGLIWTREVLNLRIENVLDPTNPAVVTFQMIQEQAARQVVYSFRYKYFWEEGVLHCIPHFTWLRGKLEVLSGQVLLPEEFFKREILRAFGYSKVELTEIDGDPICLVPSLTPLERYSLTPKVALLSDIITASSSFAEQVEQLARDLLIPSSDMENSVYAAESDSTTTSES